MVWYATVLLNSSPMSARRCSEKKRVKIDPHAMSRNVVEVYKNCPLESLKSLAVVDVVVRWLHQHAEIMGAALIVANFSLMEKRGTAAKSCTLVSKGMFI